MSIRNELKYFSGLEDRKKFKLGGKEVYELNESEDKEYKKLELQTKLLKAFQDFALNIKQFKWDLESRGPYSVSDEDKNTIEKRLKEIKEIKTMLASLAHNKLEVVSNLIDDIFGEAEDEEDEEEEEEEEDEEETSDDEDDDEEDFGE